jgi:hypothetical protein
MALPTAGVCCCYEPVDVVGRQSAKQHLQFYEVCEPVDSVAVHPVHETVDIFHGIFNSKIIPLNLIIPRPR